jgi:hypothetical protein
MNKKFFGFIFAFVLIGLFLGNFVFAADPNISITTQSLIQNSQVNKSNWSISLNLNGVPSGENINLRIYKKDSSQSYPPSISVLDNSYPIFANTNIKVLPNVNKYTVSTGNVLESGKSYFAIATWYSILKDSNGYWASDFLPIDVVDNTTKPLLPEILSISPKEGNVGDTITINGNNFTGIDKILFGNIDIGTNFNVVNINQITAKIPVGAVDGKITIKTQKLGDAVSPYNFYISSSVSNLAQITSFFPNEGKAGDEITITGKNLIGVNKITFGIADTIPVTNNGLTEITVKVPSNANSGKITVYTDSHGNVSSSSYFTVTSSANNNPIKTDVASPNTDNTANSTANTAISVSDSKGGGLVPKCNTGAIDMATGQYSNPCDFNYFMALINGLINFLLFVIATPLVALIIMYTGYLFLTAGGSAGQTEKAKKILFNVVIGYVIALAAWLVINTIMGALKVDPEANKFMENVKN